ncbi:cytochrome c oxidase accessory protein CcoG [Rhodoferax antarcticus]|uniref:Cytochrome c oxidase accessory protein CcoG n=1 Tax=Rhodoferax antarcticus ANT.BR TaxID=1111071 RepID=A0A1Q8YBQ3_9BURK|nr:cytochrome c oxidase accessory protein CcoG [Rhodoferax antarcticus]APW46603.1 cytochrome c oxidase accessory protein CcoG [Rhodoferax antarcticus]MCW2313206.1 cytochrome c oxidase accessory protein FixG [Rhodoferax antarcticus]OLP05474.1 cytochrome c oxidase accessory protein CcoG [Rhodoferax antarcticus ANT.BR]
MNAEVKEVKKVIPIMPVAPEPELVSLYAAHEKIYPRSVKGVFSNWRWIMVWVTQIVFYGLPWIEWGQRQAVLFDLGVRRFYIFGLVLYPQDFIYLTGMLIIAALSLFLFTAVAGRLWCGYACPQTVYTEMFLWVEQLVEGDRSARMRRDAGPMSAQKIGRKTGKHLIWLLIGLWTGFTFVGYFTPIQTMVSQVSTLNFGPWETFWVLFYGFATYGNAGFMREQVCKHMCPYARFQSVMFDNDTLIVTYDTERGEPRGGRSKKADPTKLSLGACVDCNLCVQVCPTGIDIRNGLQYECIGCGACADVCDTVMDKVGYPRGLIKYSTENAMTNKWTQKQTLRHVFRPRILVYTGILMVIVIAIMVSLATRTPFKVDVVRDRGVMARVVDAGKTENVYRLQVMNATETDQRYRFSVSGLPGLVLTSEDLVSVKSTEARTVPMRIQLPFEGAPAGSHQIQIIIESLDSPGKLVEKTTFLVPKQ